MWASCDLPFRVSPTTLHCLVPLPSGDMHEYFWLIYSLVGLATLAYLQRWLWPDRQQLKHIPAVGSTAPILSYWGAIRWLSHGTEITQEGYRKFKGHPFKVANFNRWLVLVSGPQLIDDIRKASDHELSFDEAAWETLEVQYTVGPSVAGNSYHVPIVRGQLTRNLPFLFDDLRDEIAKAFHDQVPLADDWTPVLAHPAVMQVVARATNRAFVGAPKCRDPDWLDLSIQFTSDLILGAHIIHQFPRFLKPLAARLFTRVPAAIRRGRRHLERTIEYRKKCLEQYGDSWPDKPNDLISWLLDEAEGDERTVQNLVTRILALEFAAIHTTSNSFVHALYHLAAHPEWAKDLREEIEPVAKREGWSKASLDKMHRLDSFLKECQRYYAIGGVTMVRRAMKDFTFSDGTVVPEGTFVGVAVLATQHDPEYYEDPDTFRPWRFSELREDDDESGRHLMVSTGLEYFPFGHGRHACPGRFFAAAQLKLILAHIVLHYDIKAENEGVVPPVLQFGQNIAPNMKAKVLFRKRQP
ncbi:cytochrome P450 [Phanerochaete sordida]|uniref:Cytochrome P450 n=1 Tax=Phanerochaete sordida TaxID=48140 RepID=A0A9P3LE38_9APHY|nr:cytochrome P450 [Phanerochaete sordida]